MIRPWPEIVERYRTDMGSGDFRLAWRGVGAVAEFIAETRLSRSLFGWTSMHDLCVQQVDLAPKSGPYLRVSPLPSGRVAFHYFDAAVRSAEWHREVMAADAVKRFERFLEELSWVAKISRDGPGAACG